VTSFKELTRGPVALRLEMESTSLSGIPSGGGGGGSSGLEEKRLQEHRYPLSEPSTLDSDLGTDRPASERIYIYVHTYIPALPEEEEEEAAAALRRSAFRNSDIRSRLFGPSYCNGTVLQREFFIDKLMVRIHFIIVMIRWTGLAPREFEFPFPGSLTSTFLG